jgi:tetratricopeptide (TPR) repeat protein
VNTRTRPRRGPVPRRNRTRSLAHGLVAVLLTGLAACAPKTAPPVVAPSFPDFVFPAVPTRLGDSDTVARHQRGWRYLQAGDPTSAEREFSAAVTRSRGFYPAETGLGDVSLVRRDFRSGLAHFDRALKLSPAYAPALVGRGEALLGLSRPDEAARSFEAALGADPALAAVRQRLQVLALRSVQRNLDAARKAADQGRLDEAKAAYLRAIAASPDSAFLYRDLAAVERKQGEADEALQHLRKALSLEPGDARSLVQIGEILEARNDFEGAATAYADAVAIEPNDTLAERAAALRERTERARLPEEYRQIKASPQVTRADLAALIGVEFDGLLQSARRREGVVITDLRGSWAAPWIQSVVRAGVMDAYPNHTFQPRGIVRRSDLAQAVSRVLALLSARRPEMPRPWAQGAPRFGDLPPGHLSYPAAAAAVSAGVMPVAPGGAFQPSRPVSGVEAMDVISRLDQMARRWAPAGERREPKP